MRFIHGTRRRKVKRGTRAAVFAAALVLGSPALVRAAEYPGWSDTGWISADERECCTTAITIASRDSERACVIAGGTPSRFHRGGRQGSCAAPSSRRSAAALRCIAATARRSFGATEPEPRSRAASRRRRPSDYQDDSAKGSALN